MLPKIGILATKNITSYCKQSHKTYLAQFTITTDTLQLAVSTNHLSRSKTSHARAHDVTAAARACACSRGAVEHLHEVGGVLEVVVAVGRAEAEHERQVLDAEDLAHRPNRPQPVAEARPAAAVTHRVTAATQHRWQCSN